MEQDLERWLDDAPRLECDWESLKTTYRRSLVDLAALRFSPPVAGGSSLPAAGLPWFMTMFGRDSIFTSLQALPFAPGAGSDDAAGARRVAGQRARRLPRRGSRPDPARDALRRDDRLRGAAALAVLRLRRRHAALRRAARRVRALDRRPQARARARARGARGARTGSTSTPTCSGNGYISYQRRNEKTGLENQCWKDSWDSISYRDGRLPGFPRATCELQGYAYDAKMRGARLARHVWKDPAFADRLEKEAADLKRRFNRDFWVEDGEYFALALDAEGKQVDALASNNGHLLWSGIVDKSKAKAVARHLMGPKLFSGWGVRTLAEGEGRYNPIGYHVGTVWPFDNSFIAWGLRRYGFKEEAARDRRRASSTRRSSSTGACPRRSAATRAPQTKYPVQYPTACSPQAWSTGAPCSCCGRCSASSPRASTSSSTRRCRATSAASSCSTSPAAGAASTRSAAGASMSTPQARARSRAKRRPKRHERLKREREE